MATPTEALNDYIARIPDWRLPARIRQRLTRLVKLAESLPETGMTPFGDRHLGLQVRKKTFAYFLNSHHDDDIVCMCFKSTLDRQRSLIKRDSKHYCIPAYLGPSGWVSVRLDRASLDWDTARDLLTSAYKLQAPKRILEALAAPMAQKKSTPQRRKGHREGAKS
jgi:phosphoribosylglycinamide formyltransferase-1